VSGIAAAGLALTGGTVRVLDATGKPVTVTNKDIAASTGAYGPITLGNAVPYRIEACGTLGDKRVCLWGSTRVGGTVNLTPLTSAITVLASGQSPETLMTGAAQGLTEADITAAHAQVRTPLAPALAEAGLASDFDLLAGPLTAGSHTGQDRLLDTVAVAAGADTKAYVALSSRFGTGVAYLEPGATPQGSLGLDAAATAALDLPGLNQLFTSMNAAIQLKDSCQAELTPLFDSSARATAYTTTPQGVETANGSGAEQASQLLCLVVAGVLGDHGPLAGGKLLPPVIDRCDFGATDPICRVNLVYALPSKDTKLMSLPRPLGIEQAAVKRASGWKFLGNRLDVQASATARLVLTRRVDSTGAADTYRRYVDIGIPVVGNLQCARVSQKDGSGADVPLAYFKKHGNGRYLSLWSVGTNDSTPSLDAAAGATRGTDAISLPVPSGAAGDTTARNFARAGRALRIELFSDSGCATPLGGADGGAVSVDMAGQLPITVAGMSGQPWPALAAASVTALTGLKGAVGAKINFGPIWTFPRGDVTVHRIQFCTLDANCGNKLAELELAGNATAAALSATLGIVGLDAKDYKLLRLTGRTSDGLVLQLDSASCSANTAASQPC
jgi:hypothetical protein